MASGPWIVYDNWLAVRNSCTDCVSGQLGRVALLESTYAIDVVNHKVLADVSGFVPAANYDGDKDVTFADLPPSSGIGGITVTANPIWTATGGSISILYAVVYLVSTGNLIAVVKLDTTDTPITVLDGSTFELKMTLNGIYKDVRT